MRRNISVIWMVAQREFTDQFRDWRIVVPMILMVSIFPFVADSTTRQAVNFMNRFGGDIILDRLIPFAILVIGFFPLSFTLLVALEAFVGEKERGTIEPLLSSPLENWQLYFGKLLLGIFTPLMASFISIIFYLIMATRQGLSIPPWYIIIQLFILTTAHAVLMVSAAIVISVQATTIRAANLMASFVVVPVAFLLQGETALIFWGDENILFVAVIGLLLISGLFVRLGLAHFKREYLLGREIDTLNFKHSWRVFIQRVTGNAQSVGQWYRREVPVILKELRTPLLLVAGIAVVTIAIDYAFGWEVVGGFQKTFEEHGGQIVQKLWPPLGTTDFAPFLSQIKRDADAVFALMVAASSLRFPKQYETAGLKARLPLIGGGTTFDEFVLPSLGDEAIGGISPLIYSAALDTPVNKRFVAEYRKRYGKVPSYYSETCYTTARWIAQAATAIKGKVEDREAFLTALRKVEIPDAPRGPIRLDAHGNPVQNIYIRKVEKKDGELWNTVVHTYPNVSQFWTYKPEEFLKQPVYDRNFPPCKHC